MKTPAVDSPLENDLHRFGPDCPVTVPHPVMRHRWASLTFLHWAFDPAAVQRLLPPGLRVDTFDGRAWVGLVPFFMDVAPPHGPSVPWLLHFCETNVRTYVVAPDGTRGVWFFSLDAQRLAAVVAARATYRMPYFWSAMRLDRRGDELVYRCRRRWPGPRGVSSVVGVRPGDPMAATELDERDHFLTARWRLYQVRRHHALGAAWAWHEPWPLYRADVTQLDDGLVEAAGLPTPVGAPLVHWSPGVDVRIGLPRLIA